MYLFKRDLLNKISQQTLSAPNRRTMVNPALIGETGSLINNIKELTIKEDRKFIEAACNICYHRQHVIFVT